MADSLIIVAEGRRFTVLFRDHPEFHRWQTVQNPVNIHHDVVVLMVPEDGKRAGCTWTSHDRQAFNLSCEWPPSVLVPTPHHLL
jgi:hypothetical protein